jgi:hypothetical protein
MRARAALTSLGAGLHRHGRRHGRSLTLLSLATVFAALHVPLWAYERGLLGPADPHLRQFLAPAVRLVALLRGAAWLATVWAAWLVAVDVREQWLALVGRLLVVDVRGTDRAGRRRRRGGVRGEAGPPSGAG